MPLPDLLKNSFKKREAYVKSNGLQAYRIYNQEDPTFPAAIDFYLKNAVIHVFDESALSRQAEMEQVLKHDFGIEHFFYKNRTKKKDLPLPNHSSSKFIVQEYGHQFWVNLSDYLDTGLFLDHRETRGWVQGQSAGKKVLNTFAYTGSFTVYAAAGRATMSHSVDLSGTYTDWMKENFELNGLDSKAHAVYPMDIWDYLKYAQKKRFCFDLIIVDPPTFSRNKSASFSVQKDHPRLLNEIAKLLLPKGKILFSTNDREFRFENHLLKPLVFHPKNDTIPPDFSGPRPHQVFINLLE